ncbi:hypothetical protein B484DRAFT_407947, partial [Ochromonadaceae sp. CCMP2298]
MRLFLHNFIALGLVALAQVRVAQAAVTCSWAVSSSPAGVWTSTAINDAGTLILASIRNVGIFSSTDGITYNALADTGSNWLQATSVPAPVQYTNLAIGTGTNAVAASISAGDKYYALAYNYENDIVLAAAFGGPIMKSTDDGASFTTLYATTRNWFAIA